MNAFNIVRVSVKPGREEHFIAVNRRVNRGLKGFRSGAIVKTGERTYFPVGEWVSLQSMVDARPKMIEMLDGFRDDLEDLGGGLGVTDPASGEVVLELPAAAPTAEK